MMEKKKQHYRYSRHLPNDLMIQVARRGFMGLLKLSPNTKCIEFSLSGMRFQSDQPFKVNQTLVIDLCLRDIEAKEINAVVLNCIASGDHHFCTEVEFCFESRHMQHKRVEQVLRMVEDKFRLAEEFPA